MTRFGDRAAAGRALAAALRERALPAPVVLALPRGGVPVAAEVARALGAPLDLVMVAKIGVPGQRELAAGAVVDGDRPEIVVNHEVAAYAGLTRGELERLADSELAELHRRRRLYLPERSAVPIAGRTAIVIDDGIATGTTMRAALQAVRRRAPALSVLAVPVAPPDTAAALAGEVDLTVCLATPRHFEAVSLHYDDFAQVDDATVTRLLAGAR